MSVYRMGPRPVGYGTKQALPNKGWYPSRQKAQRAIERITKRDARHRARKGLPESDIPEPEAPEPDDGGKDEDDDEAGGKGEEGVYEPISFPGGEGDGNGGGGGGSGPGWGPLHGLRGYGDDFLPKLAEKTAEATVGWVADQIGVTEGGATVREYRRRMRQERHKAKKANKKAARAAKKKAKQEKSSVHGGDTYGPDGISSGDEEVGVYHGYGEVAGTGNGWQALVRPALALALLYGVYIYATGERGYSVY